MAKRKKPAKKKSRVTANRDRFGRLGPLVKKLTKAHQELRRAQRVAAAKMRALDRDMAALSRD